MQSSKFFLQAHKHNGKDQHQYFKGLLNERRLFPTLWHWCVHGLGLGQEPTGFKPDKSEQLLRMSLALCQKVGNEYQDFTHHLLKGIVAACMEIQQGRHSFEQNSQNHFLIAIERFPSNTWQYARACALLTESLVKLDCLDPYRRSIRQHLEAALQQVINLDVSSDKLRYEQVHLLANLLLAAGQAEFNDLLQKSQNGCTFAEAALKIASKISDIFYCGRVTAIIFSVMAVIYQEGQICANQQKHLRSLLDKFDTHLSYPSQRVADGVHQGDDFYIFPLLLVLNSIAVLNWQEYLTYKRNWIQQAMVLFQSLAPTSQTSQISFLVHALNNLGVIDAYVPNMINFFHDSMEKYLQTTDFFRVDDYLRCAYLIHLSFQLGFPELVDSKIWSTMLNSTLHLEDSECYLESPYGSSYMVAAYSLSAYDRADQLNVLFSDQLDLSAKVKLFKDSSRITNIYSQRTTLALIEAGLRMRPVGTGDTSLFSRIKLA